MSTLINSTSLGNIIIVTGSFLLLLVLVKLFAWDQITGIFKAREEKIANDIDVIGSSEANHAPLTRIATSNRVRARDQIANDIDVIGSS